MKEANVCRAPSDCKSSCFRTNANQKRNKRINVSINEYWNWHNINSFGIFSRFVWRKFVVGRLDVHRDDFLFSVPFHTTHLCLIEFSQWISIITLRLIRMFVGVVVGWLVFFCAFRIFALRFLSIILSVFTLTNDNQHYSLHTVHMQFISSFKKK